MHCEYELFYVVGMSADCADCVSQEKAARGALKESLILVLCIYILVEDKPDGTAVVLWIFRIDSVRNPGTDTEAIIQNQISFSMRTMFA